MAALAGVFALALAGAALSAQPSGGSETLASAGPSAANSTPTPVDRSDGIAAIVNDTPISEFDLRQRVALFMATSGVRPGPKQMKEIREQVLKQLETERLQLLEAQKLNITVSSGEVDKAVNNILSDNHLKMAQLKAMLNKSGVYMSTLRGQIAVQIAWSKAVQGRYGGDVNVTPAEIDAEMKRVAEGANKPRFRVSEIFMPVDSPEQADKVKHDMGELENQIHLGAPFPAVARQFSQSPTAAKGGDLGWVFEGQLQPELNKVLLTMRPGSVSQPIRAAGGYYILALRAREEPEGTKLPTQTKPKYPPGVLPLARVLVPIGPKPPKALLKRAVQAAGAIRANIRSCAQLPDMVGQMKGIVYMNLGSMHLTQLSKQMQTALANTGPGQTTQPFRSAAGIELIVRCDAPPPKITTFKMPTRNQVEQKLFQEQITVLARRYMRDLRRNADIETR
jgi:peptidyl-prolyl cis-trans isomerase SurA